MKFSIFPALILGVTLLFSFGPASAQKILENFLKPMPEIAPIPAEEFEKQTKLVEDAPYGDKDLAYTIRLPEGWESADSKSATGYSINNIVLGEVGRYYGPPQEDMRSHVTVQAMELKYQLTAEQWMIQYIISQGLPLQGFQKINSNRVEAIFVRIEKDINYVVRAAAVVNGKRVVMLSYSVPTKFWEGDAQIQAEVVRSFTLTNPKKEFVEEMQEYRFLDIARIQFPKSWSLRTQPVRSVDRMSAELFNVAIDDLGGKKDRKTLNGKMSVNLVSTYVVETLEDEIDKFKQDLSANGLYLGDVIESPQDFEFSDDFEFAKVTVFQASDNQDALLDYEFWLAVMSAGDYYYFVTLLTPHRDEDYFLWSRNVQTFRLVASLVTQEGQEE